MLEVFILQLFGAYGSDVLVIVTGILAVITGFYAFQTWRTVKVMDKASRMEFLPKIKGHIHMVGPVHIDFRISNVGKGSASDVLVSFAVVGQNTISKTWTQPLMKPNEFQDFFIPISEEETESNVPYFENNETRIDISATYKDILGQSHSSREVIDVSEFVRQFRRTLSVYDEGTTEKTSRNLQTISDEVMNITRNISKIGDILSDRKHRDVIEFRFRNIYYRLNQLNLRFDTNTELGILIRSLETELLTYRRNDLILEVLKRIKETNPDVHSEIIGQFDEFTHMQ